MKTIQISDGLWQRLKLEGVARGVTMREVVESMGAEWISRHPRDLIGLHVELVATRGAMDALKAIKAVPIESASDVRELVVELEE